MFKERNPVGIEKVVLAPLQRRWQVLKLSHLIREVQDEIKRYYFDKFRFVNQRPSFSLETVDGRRIRFSETNGQDAWVDQLINPSMACIMPGSWQAALTNCLSSSSGDSMAACLSSLRIQEDGLDSPCLQQGFVGFWRQKKVQSFCLKLEPEILFARHCFMGLAGEISVCPFFYDDQSFRDLVASSFGFFLGEKRIG